jgi:hypothetical protein
MNDPRNLIQEQLQQAGAASSVTPELLRLDAYRITSDIALPEEEFLFRLFDVQCFPRRDLTTITGLEKCGKTFFTSMLMAAAAYPAGADKTSEFFPCLARGRERPLKVLWYDTEQSRQSTRNILKNRVAKLVGDTFPEEQFFAFNVRSCTCEERLDMLATGIESYRPDIVIIDNISDLLPSINDGEASVQVVASLMQLASTYDCNITVVIHLNKSGEKRNLRGWLGTELLHKSFEVFYCERIYNTKVFSVEQTLTRMFDIDETLYYEVTDAGLPKQSKKPNIQPRNAQGQFVSTKQDSLQVTNDKMESFNQNYIIQHPDDAQNPWEWDLRRLFADAMGGCAMIGIDSLKQTVMQRGNILSSRYYEKVFTMAEDLSIIKKTMDRNGRVVVLMP